MFRVVNGYVCTSSCDVAAAKRGADPKNPRNDPVKAQELAEKRALASGKPADDKTVFKVDPTEAVSFGGRLSGRVPGAPAIAPMGRLDKLA